MLKIGIIGSESTHSETFAGMANFPARDGALPFDARVTAIWGEDPVRTQQVAKQKNIPCVLKNPEEMIGKVDAVMVMPRRGSRHFQYAMPFLKAGVPTWVDKPFTVDYGEAATMVKTAKQHHAMICGGSTCKECFDVAMLKELFKQLQSAGGMISAAFNFAGDIASEYDGIYFYGSHSAEILTAVFGGEVKSIRTDVHKGNLIALAKYPDFTVSMNFSQVPQSYGILYAPSGVVIRPINISLAYDEAFRKFIDTAEKKRPAEDPRNLLLSVRILNAIEESIRNGGDEISVKPVDEE